MPRHRGIAGLEVPCCHHLGDGDVADVRAAEAHVFQLGPLFRGEGEGCKRAGRALLGHRGLELAQIERAVHFRTSGGSYTFGAVTTAVVQVAGPPRALFALSFLLDSSTPPAPIPASPSPF